MIVLIPWTLLAAPPAEACLNELRAAIARAAPEDRAEVLTRGLEERLARERAAEEREKAEAKRAAAEAAEARRAERRRRALDEQLALARTRQLYAAFGVAFGIAGTLGFGAFTVLSFAREYAATFPGRSRWIA